MRFQVLLNELGFDEGLVTPLRQRYLQPVASLLFPDCGGGCLDSHKAFVVKYDMSQDLELSYHYDNAEVTLNVSVGKDFTGGNLYFGALRQVRRSFSFRCAGCHDDRRSTQNVRADDGSCRECSRRFPRAKPSARRWSTG